MCPKQNVNYGKQNEMPADTPPKNGVQPRRGPPFTKACEWAPETHHSGSQRLEWSRRLLNHKHTERIQQKKRLNFIHTYQTNLPSPPQCLPLCNRNMLGLAQALVTEISSTRNFKSTNFTKHDLLSKLPCTETAWRGVINSFLCHLLNRAKH